MAMNAATLRDRPGAAARKRRRVGAAVAAVAAGLALGACSTTRLDAQWVNPQAAAQPLMHGAKVMVACEAYEPVVKQLCVDHMSSELVARGANPVTAPEVANSTPGRPVPDDQLLAAARTSGAVAVLVTTVTSTSAGASGSGFSIGLGGFGGGSHVGGGVGVSLPIGGGNPEVGYQANAKLMDLTGRPAWTAMASTGPSGNVSTQIDQLTHTLADAADKAGLF
jgi:hypothetical protein